MPRLPVAMSDPDPRSSLRAVLDAFARFWSGDRRIIRHLRALASLDPEVDTGIRNRDVWRRGIVTALVSRLAPKVDDAMRSDVIETLLVIAGFETFDKLADARGDDEAARLTSEMVSAMFARAGVAID
jgi:hypothetical protein